MPLLRKNSRTREKDPSDVMDIAMDFRLYLTSISDTAASIVATSQNITIDEQSTEDGVCTVRVSGGRAGSNGVLTFTCTSTGGAVLERSLTVPVANL